MAAYNYSALAGQNSAKSVGVSLAISTKKSIEICNHIRGKQLGHAKKILHDAMELKRPIPHRRFNDNTGHKHGMAAGRFAVDACKEILFILASAEANAQAKGLSTSNLIVRHISAQQGPKVWHYGRQRRRKAKRTHIEVILDENKQAEKQKPAREKRQKQTAAPQSPHPQKTEDKKQ